ncbi:MAG: TolC family protein [candidate division KSB1 bacterium]|nr:TolC family protein [candidate division KSB1 bacterium]MDZ7300720.1 TolC family protein [candidate division KSB1 bacterium]MDZ7310010.1 TolC family protein [candidate division KSB1 bacterium]
MNHVRLLTLLVVLGICWGNTSFSQSTSSDSTARVLTLQNAIDYALQRSFDVKFLGLSLESARQNLLARKGSFKTNAQLRLDTPNLTEGLQLVDNPDPGGLPLYKTSGNLRFSSTLDVNQPLPTNGVFTVFSQLYQQDVSAYNVSTGIRSKQRNFYTSLGLRLSQPLFTINTLKLGYEEANLNYERASGEIRRTELDVIYNVTQAFYALYRAKRALEIAREEMLQQEEAYNLASKKYAAGLIPEVEALQTEVDLAQSRNRLFTAESALRRQEDIFKQTIGMPLTEKVTVQTQVEFRPFSIDLEKAIAHGLANRSEIREQTIERRLQEIALKRTDARSEFKAELTASYDLSGISDQRLPYHTTTGELFRSSWEDLKNRPKNRGVVLSVSLPLWDSGVNGAEVASAKARLDQAALVLENERITVEREIKEVVARVREAENRLSVLEKSQKLAERSYEISLARFDNGDITAQDLALDRNRLTQARSAYLDAYIDYQTAVADLKRKTLYDFAGNRSLVGGEKEE